MSIELIHGDCLEEMKYIVDGSVDAIITDPPYGTIKNAALDGWKNRDTGWDCIIDHDIMLKECNRVLHMNGALLLFAQEPYTSKLITETHGNLPFSYRLTWLKDHFANCLFAKKAPVYYTEDICVFFKKYDCSMQHPLRLYAKKIMDFLGLTLKEINKKLGHRKAEHFFYITSTQFGLCTESVYNELINIYKIDKQQWFKSYACLEKLNHKVNRKINLQGRKYKSNVLEYKKDYGRLHPTQKPEALMEDLIKTYTNEKDTVLDFTMGSGTTGIACKNLNRNFIGIERKKEYFEIAKKRIENTQLTLKGV